MIFRLTIALLLTIIIQSCEADTKNISVTQNSSTIVSTNSNEVENTITNFSIAVTEKKRDLLLKMADQKGIYLVRLFTSGNLGGRGSSLSQLVSLKTLDNELSFPIQKQTPYDIPGMFMRLPIKPFNTLPKMTLPPEIDNTHFDQWAPILKAKLKTSPENVVHRKSLILSSTTSKYWVYSEAQIIDDILVGDFAIFLMQDGKLKLVSFIELL